MRQAFTHLVPLLRDIHYVRCMSLADWDETLRLARQARLLGLIANRLKAPGAPWSNLPEAVKGHLRSAINYAAYRRQAVRMELNEIRQALPADRKVVLLKGAAYIAQSLDCAQGRMPNDVDLLVRRDDIGEVEAALRSAGWVSEVVDEYDDHYYREWSHELPPMRFPGHALEVDLHHTIAPVTSRTRADDELLFAGLVSLPDCQYFVLDPRDQIIHAAIHLFQDTELDGRLRDLVDIDGLVRQHLLNTADWAELLRRAERHKATRLLWYALYFARVWLATPVPTPLLMPAPGRFARWGMVWLMERNCLPYLPDRRPTMSERCAGIAGQVRYHLLRMPPALLVRHAMTKAWRCMPRLVRQPK